MAPRKSNASTQSTAGAEDPAAPASDGMSVEDLQLPRSMIQRLAKGVLPANTSIQKDALLAMSKSATVFVNYLTSASNESTIRAGKKTIQVQDVLDAITDLEFPEFLPRLEAELQKYIAIQCDKRNSYRAGVRVRQRAAEVVAAPTEPADGANGASSADTDKLATVALSPAASNGQSRGSADFDGERAPKRARMTLGGGSGSGSGSGVNRGRREEGEEEETLSDMEDGAEGEGEDRGGEEEGEDEEDAGDGDEEEEGSGEDEDALVEDRIEGYEERDEGSGEGSGEGSEEESD